MGKFKPRDHERCFLPGRFGGTYIQPSPRTRTFRPPKQRTEPKHLSEPEQEVSRLPGGGLSRACALAPRPGAGRPRLPGGARQRRAVRGMRGGHQAPPPRSAGAEAAGTSKTRHKPPLPAARWGPLPRGVRPDQRSQEAGDGRGHGALRPVCSSPVPARNNLQKSPIPGREGEGRRRLAARAAPGAGP